MRISRCAVYLLLVLSTAASSAPAGGESPYWAGPSRLDDTEALTETMRDQGATSLPLEALVYYELAMDSYGRGDRSQALRHLQSSIALDGSFPEAHFAVARITFPRGASWGALRDGLRATFNSSGSQHQFLVNGVVGGLLALSMGAFLLLIFSSAQLLSRVQHVISELLTRWFPRPVAAVAAVLILVAPFVWGIGFLPAWLLLGGVLWPWLQKAQRQWVLGLVAATLLVPAILWAASPVLLSPLDPTGTPFLLSRAMSSLDNPGLRHGIEQAIEKDPNNPNLHFAHGLLDKRAGRLQSSRRYFTRSLELGGPNAAIRNNLGVLAFLQGNYDNAVDYFRQAVEADKNLAAPHFNLSQAFAKKLYFDKADVELKEANRLAFSRIRSIIKHQRGGRNNTLLDELLPASAFWKEAARGPRVMPQLPPQMAVVFPGPLASLGGVCLPLFGIGILIGRRMYKYLASFECTNCRRPVCRRCLRRIQKQPYCKTCGEALLQVQSVAYSKLVLDSRLKRTGRAHSLVTKSLDWALPGYHALRIGKTHVAAALCVATVAALFGLFMGKLPIDRMAWVSSEPGPWWPEIPILTLIAVQLSSWLTLWKLDESEEAAEADDEEFAQEFAAHFGEEAA